METTEVARLFSWQFFRFVSKRLLRYGGVSLIVVPLTQVLLVFFYTAADLPAMAANALAVTIAAIPAYFLSRRWVWNKVASHSVSREVIPFWIMNLLGLLLSTLFVWLVGLISDSAILLVIANVFAFGILWLVKFMLCEIWLFAVPEDGSEDGDFVSGSVSEVSGAVLAEAEIVEKDDTA